MGFPEAVFFERLRNPDQLDGTGDAFACGKLHEKRQLEFEAAFDGAGCLSKSDYAEHGASSKFPRPMKRGEHSPLKSACVRENCTTLKVPGDLTQ